MRLLARAVLATVALAGCNSYDPYACDSDQRCTAPGRVGRCVAAGESRYCAFDDDACPSRLRFDPSAAPSVAGQCAPDPGGPPDLASADRTPPLDGEAPDRAIVDGDPIDSALPDGAAKDLADVDLAGIEEPMDLAGDDLPPGPDLALPPPDLAGVDLTGSDLATPLPDLAGPVSDLPAVDKGVGDLGAPDLSMPVDLATKDFAVIPDLAGDMAVNLAVPRVLICAADSSMAAQNLRVALEATKAFVSVAVKDCEAAIPTAAELKNYDVVLVWNTILQGYKDSATLGMVLNTYIAGGGGVVRAMYTLASGREITGFNYPCLSAGTISGANALKAQAKEPASPLAAGVMGLGNANSASGGALFAAAGAASVWDYASDVSAIARCQLQLRRRVDLNFYPGTATGEATVAVKNALQWVLNGTPIWSGSDSLWFASNFVGTPLVSSSVTIKNVAASSVVVSAAVGGANPGDFTFNGTSPSMLAAGASYTYTVTFAPKAAGPRSATLTFSVPGWPSIDVPINSSATLRGLFFSSYQATGDQLYAAIATADLDGDGRPDLVVAPQNSGTVTVMLAAGAGSFQSTSYALSAQTALAIGDFDGNGKPDIAAISPNNSYVSVLYNTGAGKFGAPISYNTPASNGFLVVGDFTGDGKIDIVTSTGAQVSVLVNGGQGVFNAPVITNATSGGLSAADLDGDGMSDLVAANAGGDVKVFVLRSVGAGKFANAVSYGVKNNVTSTAVGDLDGDGKPDVAATLGANPGYHQVAVLLNSGNGTLKAPTYGCLVTSNVPPTPKIADIDGDGRADVVVPSGNTGVTVCRNLVNGLLTTGPYSGTRSSGLAIGDFNGDGRFDVATAGLTNNSPRALEILWNSGGGGLGLFAPAGTGPRGIAAGKLDGDAFNDLVVANSGSGNITVLRGLGAGTFAPQPAVMAGMSPYHVALGDFNADGKLDAAVALAGEGKVLVMTGAGTGALTPGASFTTGMAPHYVAVGDVSGDAKPDLVVVNNGSKSVSVLLGAGAGMFAPAQSYAVGTAPVAVVIADLNNDKKLDLAVANYGTADVSVLLNQGNGLFGGALAFAAGSNPASLAVADYNQDTFPDLVVANFTDNTVSLLLNEGAGAFPVRKTFAVGGAGYNWAVAGLFNADAVPDVALVRASGNPIHVLRGNGAGLLPLLVTPDYEFTTSPFGKQPWAVVAADFNNDGKLDLAYTDFALNVVGTLLNFSQ
ncbi:MAG: VCBS repeat-containing protein [Myxococcales bacterium]|nr:VCBS repeat-containing protein [Myxococcales bacterium]